MWFELEASWSRDLIWVNLRNGYLNRPFGINHATAKKKPFGINRATAKKKKKTTYMIMMVVRNKILKMWYCHIDIEDRWLTLDYHDYGYGFEVYTGLASWPLSLIKRWKVTCLVIGEWTHGTMQMQWRRFRRRLLAAASASAQIGWFWLLRVRKGIPKQRWRWWCN